MQQRQSSFLFVVFLLAFPFFANAFSNLFMFLFYIFKCFFFPRFANTFRSVWWQADTSDVSWQKSLTTFGGKSVVTKISTDGGNTWCIAGNSFCDEDIKKHHLKFTVSVCLDKIRRDKLMCRSECIESSLNRWTNTGHRYRIHHAVKQMLKQY